MKLQRVEWLFKRLKVVSAILIFAGAIQSCNDDESPDQQEDIHVGVPTPVGTPNGEAESFEVGADGGTFRSADGNVEIIIPEGAISSTTIIGIQSLENTAPNGIGNSYRLSPHGLSFAVPVTVSFYYDQEMISFFDGLAIAYQENDNVWYWPGNLTRNAITRKVSVQTFHFSDWSLFETMHLIPRDTTVLPGDEVQLKAIRVIPDLITPLVDVDPIALGEQKPLEARFIKQWDLAGEGELIPSENTAVYVAPSSMPGSPAIITLDLNLREGSRTFLVSQVTVGQTKVTLNGGPFQNFTATSNAPAEAVYNQSITTVSFPAVNNGILISVIIAFPGKGTGQEAWNLETCHINTSHGAIGTGGDVQLDNWSIGNVFIPSDPPSVHPGFVKITSYGEVGQFITGTFEGGYTFYNLTDFQYGSISGSFIAVRK